VLVFVDAEVTVNKSSSRESSLVPPPAPVATDSRDETSEEHVCQNNSIPSGGAQLLDSLLTGALRSDMSSPSAPTSNGGTPLPDIFSLLNADNLPTATQQTPASPYTVAQQQAFYRWRHVLCFIIGIVVRLSLLTDFGAEYVQVGLGNN
jgi:hypothetical protein